MAIRHFPTHCSVCDWTGYFEKDLPTPDFPDETVENCPHHGGPGLERMTREVNVVGLTEVRTR